MKSTRHLPIVFLFGLVSLGVLLVILCFHDRHGVDQPVRRLPAAGLTSHQGPVPATPRQFSRPASALPARTVAAATNPPPPGFASGSPAVVVNTPISEHALKQIAALELEKAERTPVERKLDSQLLYAERMRRGDPVAAGVPVQRIDLEQDPQGRVLVDLKADVTAALVRAIEVMGGMVINRFPQYQAIRAAVPLAGLETLAARPEVRFVEPAVRAARNAVVSEGDYAHQANTARATFGINGSGVRVGVLSDSVDFLGSSKIAGLVTVVPGQDGLNHGGSGEGTAMLEIVHDLAPGAQLYFATADNGTAQFASNIYTLRFTYGCDILVDDVTYFNESPFQDGIVAQAVNAVTASGGLYFSSAGNSGSLDSGTSGTWEGDFVNGGVAGPPVNGKSGFLHDFDTGNYDTVVQASDAGRDTVLFWSDPLGASTNDYDLFVLDSSGTSVVNSSLNSQTGTQDPYEHVAAPNAGERIVVVQASGAGRFLHLDTQRGVLAIGTPGNTRGHNAATNGFCVAAVDVAHTVYPNAFAGGSRDPVENFSSDGPRRMFYFPDGTPITPGDLSATGGAVYAKPDLTGADGVTTDVPGFAPFYGTSAAAPHAAAIAALLKSYAPGLTAGQLRAVLADSALDVMAPGLDRDSGAGIGMALAALQAAFPDALQVSPGSGLISSGPAGGPFSPTTLDLVLTNTGAAALNWSLADTSTWLNVSCTTGTLSPGGPAAGVTVSLNCPAAASLPAGVYDADVSLTNLNSGNVQSRRFTLVSLAPAMPAASADAVLALEPVAYWRLNETNQPPLAQEAGNHGTAGPDGNGFALGGVSSGQTGVVSNGCRFYNPNLNVPYYGSRVDVPYMAALNPAGPFTVEFWAKPARLTSDLFCPACSLDPSQNGGYSRSGWIFYQTANDTWQFRVGGPSGYATTLSGGTVQTNTWQQVVGVYDGTNAWLYVNGEPAAGPYEAGGFSPNTRNPLRLGATTFPNRGFDGRLDEVAIYTNALDAETIAAHYQAATTNNADYGAQILADQPAGYWPLDELAYQPPAPGALPVALNTGSASNLYGLYEPGSQPGVAGVPFDGFGADNRACQFNGRSGFVDVPNGSLDFTGPLTLLAWIRSNPADDHAGAIVSGGDISFCLNLNGSGHPGFSDGAQFIGDIIGTNPVDDGQWHHLAGVYDGLGNEFLYVDGQLAASTTNASVPVAGSAGEVWIGGAPDHGSSELFSGSIDEVAIFTRALSAEEIQQVYSATNAPLVIAVTRTNGTLNLTWNAVVGLTYQLQYKTSLNQTNWTDLGGARLATNLTMTASELIDSDSRRFYRVILPP